MAESLKNMFSPELIQKLSELLKRHYSKLNKKKFYQDVHSEKWSSLELKQRTEHIAKTIYIHLPKDYKKALPILFKVSEEFKKGFENIVFPEFVSLYGREHWSVSMEALAHFTQFSSSEFAIRHFILDDPERAIHQMLIWSNSSNVHLRRLASEGSRPRLPWSFFIRPFIEDPKRTLKILENLMDDNEKYVQKSVANHLNDISKDHPEFILNWCKKWKNHSKNSDWIIKHALRTLLKSGNREALELFGYQEAKGIKKIELKTDQSQYPLGSILNFEVSIESKLKQRIRLEYGLDYMKSNGKTNRKIFQMGEKILEPGTNIYRKNLPLKHLSTRKLHAGKHGLAIIINGSEYAYTPFELKL